MKGFGNNFKTNKKSIEKKVKSNQKEQLITNAIFQRLLLKFIRIIDFWATLLVIQS